MKVEGKPECSHAKIYYENTGLLGSQGWRCDAPDCGRVVTLEYDPGAAGRRISFPPNALIRTPNPDYGAENWYSHKANEHGVCTAPLPKEERVECTLEQLV